MIILLPWTTISQGYWLCYVEATCVYLGMRIAVFMIDCRGDLRPRGPYWHLLLTAH